MSLRSERVAGLLQREIGRLVAVHLKDPRLTQLVALAYVTVSPDLGHATAAVTVIGTEDEAAQAMLGLESAGGYIRREVGQRLGLKRAPELHFVRDTSIEQGNRVLDLLDTIKEQESTG